MHNVALLSAKERNELFSETARQMNTTEAIAEKDFWVVWTLDKIFADELEEIIDTLEVLESEINQAGGDE